MDLLTVDVPATVDDPFDPTRWQAGATVTGRSATKAPPAEPPRRVRGKFLRGPIPWAWLQAAMALPGKAVHLGLMLWLEAGLQRSMTVHFCLMRAVRQGIPINTARRAVQALESAGLVTVRRLPGRGLDVTLVIDSGLADPLNQEKQL